MAFTWLTETVYYYLGYYQPDEKAVEQYKNVLADIPNAHRQFEKKRKSVPSKIKRLFKKSKTN